MPRPLKSDAEKAAKGTLQKCRQRVSRAISSENKLVPETPPTGLTRDARDAWQAALTNAPAGVLEAIDVGILERWCRAYAAYRRVADIVTHEGFVEDNPSGRRVVNPNFVVMQSLSADLLKMEKELGFTPCARRHVAPAAEEETEENPFT